MRRVVVTGIGVICGSGAIAASFRSWLRRAAAASVRSRHRLLDLRFRNGAEVSGYNPADHFSLKEADMIDRFAQFAVIAAREAAGHSGIEWTPELRESAAIVTGSCVGGQSTEDEGFWNVYKLGVRASTP